MSARPLTVAVVGVEFGWGSAGVLDSIIRRLVRFAPRPVRLVGVSSGLGRALLRDLGVARWYDLAGAPADQYARVVRAEGVDVALSVLDAPAATALERAGVPTVFVDVLSFLWTMGDRDWLPGEVTLYCAQRCPELPPEAEELLRHVEHLTWVGGILPASAAPAPTTSVSPAAARPGHALVALGGLKAPLVNDVRTYPRLVVPPVLEALTDLGFTSVHICGNMPDELAGEFAPFAGPGLTLTVEPLPHRRFQQATAEAEVVLTQPGLMSLLEAGAGGRPLVRLPPQNVAGIFQARFHEAATRSGCGVPWPAEVLDEEVVLSARKDGEEAANRVHYSSIDRAGAQPGAVRPSLHTALREAVARARGAQSIKWTAFTDAVGTDGADTVASHLLAVAERHR
ncbi:hydroxymethylcytosylglucuronate/cytosylglucuronate synthase [Streptomyces albus]|uniref:hydroxymethylcytosylglucuronate/cytosylglucurona te synthase n=1 Tax=Streptomyces albus TaxID=1888 RepID=UPI003F1B68A5